MNKNQKSRWEAAVKLFEKMKRAAKLSGSKIYFENMLIELEQIVITDSKIYVICDHSKYIEFDADPEIDGGLNTRKADYAKYVRSKFRLVKFTRY